MPKRVLYRLAREHDADGIYPLAKSLAISIRVQEKAFKASLKKILVDPKARILLALKDNKIIGYLLGFQRQTFYANGSIGWVEELFVTDEFREQGVGTVLMRHFEKWARIRRCKLVAVASRRAEKFYGKQGYLKTASYFKKPLVKSK